VLLPDGRKSTCKSTPNSIKIIFFVHFHERAALEHLLPALLPVPLPLKQVPHWRGTPADYAYFLETGMILLGVDLADPRRHGRSQGKPGPS
jgi:hypothetical protein